MPRRKLVRPTTATILDEEAPECSLKLVLDFLWKIVLLITSPFTHFTITGMVKYVFALPLTIWVLGKLMFFSYNWIMGCWIVRMYFGLFSLFLGISNDLRAAASNLAGKIDTDNFSQFTKTLARDI